MNENERRQHPIPQEHFEAIAKRAAELSTPMAADMAAEVVRKEMQDMFNQKVKDFPHEFYAMVGEMGFKGAVKVFWAVTGILITAGAASLITYFNLKR